MAGEMGDSPSAARCTAWMRSRSAPTKKSPEGKLRLLYEANPLAFVAEQIEAVLEDLEQALTQLRSTLKQNN